MSLRLRAGLVLFWTLFPILVSAGQEGTKGIKGITIGDAAPAWRNLPGTDGQKHSLADLKDKAVVVVVFTCNSCPIASDYEPRILEFAKTHAGPDSKVALVAINVNTIPEDSLPEMTRRATKNKYPFPYLFDASQQIARQFGAQYTPEFFVLNADRKVVYHGALDDKSPPGMPKLHYLSEAVTATLAGKPIPTPKTQPRGCKIRFLPNKNEVD